MKKIMTMALLLLFVCVVEFQAQYISQVKIQRLSPFSGGYVIVSTYNPLINGTCNYFGYQFIFDITNSATEKLYSSLMIALTTNSSIDLWFDSSLVAGTDENSGCNLNSMAILTGVGSIGQ